MPISTYTATFNLKLNSNQLYGLRGAMISHAGKKLDYFHNRKIENNEWKATIHRYPKIQYRIAKGFLEIWAFNEAIPQLKSLIKNDSIPKFRLEGHLVNLNVKKEKEVLNFSPKVVKIKAHQYRITKLIPFNQQNDEQYAKLTKLSQRIKLIEQILVNEIVLLSYAIDWPLKREEQVKVEIKDIETIGKGSYQTKNKKGKPEKFWYKTFTLVFSSNVDLLSGISLGRHKSVGYGVLEKLD